MLVIVASIGGCKSCPTKPLAPARTVRVDEAMQRAERWLEARQSDDGTWRSSTYGSFKDGDALTPLVTRALLEAGAADATKPADAGAAWIAAMVQGKEEPRPLFPVYTAAIAAQVLSHPSQAKHHDARELWVSYLRARQLTGALGWDPGDKEHGGWGYAMVIPRKPAEGAFGAPLIESNVSATVYALDALAAAGLEDGDPACGPALSFLDRMQNFGTGADPAVDDGGFHFIYDDPVRNKAGPVDPTLEHLRFRSYGSTTADGVRGLALCGRNRDHERVAAGLGWLRKHFQGDEHPGDFVERHEPDRAGLYFYWAASAAATFGQLEVDPELGGSRHWANDLADDLMERQLTDGAWRNAVPTMREDDPILATATALTALARLRAHITDS